MKLVAPYGKLIVQVEQEEESIIHPLATPVTTRLCGKVVSIRDTCYGIGDDDLVLFNPLEADYFTRDEKDYYSLGESEVLAILQEDSE